MELHEHLFRPTDPADKIVHESYAQLFRQASLPSVAMITTAALSYMTSVCLIDCDQIA